MVCVPLMGTLKKVENIIKQKPLKMQANIIICVFSAGSVYKLGMMSEQRLAASLFDRKNAPQNSAMAPRMIKVRKLAALDP